MFAGVILSVALAQAQGAIPSLASLLAARRTAMQRMGATGAKSFEMDGTLAGSALFGRFQSWHNGDNDRYDESEGVRRESTIRIGSRVYVVNSTGNVRELRGLLLQRQKSADFIDSQDFVTEPQYDRLIGLETLPDGRSAYAIEVTPPGGLPETIDLDVGTSMIDRISYDSDDGVTSEDYYAYHVVGGVLLPSREVDSNGDHAYDIIRTTLHASVGEPVPSDVFAIPANTVVQTDKPVTVPLTYRGGHNYVTVELRRRRCTFLVDTGAQAVAVDSSVAAEVGLQIEGHLEVAGVQRTGGSGIAPLGGIEIGAATLPVGVVTVLSLRDVAPPYTVDGILGYPFFASAEVRIDQAAGTMTFGKPGSLGTDGSEIPVDSDRQLVEVHGAVDGIGGRFVLDTGNTNELLIFAPFAQMHPRLAPVAASHSSYNFGVGGSTRAISTVVDELDFGPFRLFNRVAAVMATSQGAFADRFDAGNIGMGSLKNFVMTFDLAHGRMYARPGPQFDDGRFRSTYEPIYPHG